MIYVYGMINNAKNMKLFAKCLFKVICWEDSKSVTVVAIPATITHDYA